MTSLMGLEILVNGWIGPVPVMQVSQAFAAIQSQELVDSTNAWLLKRFGTYTPVYFLPNEQAFVMHPTHLALLRKGMVGDTDLTTSVVTP